MAAQSDLRFTFAVGATEFEVVSFTLDEGLSETYTLALELASLDGAIDFGQVLDQPAHFTLWQSARPVRHVWGLVSAFEQGDSGFRRTRYRAVVEPRLARLGLASDWRIFQQRSVPQILQALLTEHGIAHYEQNLTEEHLPREYCVQAGDTALDFLLRLAGEEGLFHRFVHDERGVRLIHGDRLYIHGLIDGGPVRIRHTGTQHASQAEESADAQQGTHYHYVAELARTLGDYAGEHQGLAHDAKPRQALTEAVSEMGHGANDQASGGGDGSEPVIALSAPGGIALGTPRTIALGAGEHLDAATQGHVQLSSGERTVINAGNGLSTFAQQGDMRHIAHQGELLVQAQHNDARVEAEQSIEITASQGHVLLVAKEHLTLMCGGGFIKMQDGNIELGGPGTFTVKAANHLFLGSTSMDHPLPSFLPPGSICVECLLMAAQAGSPMARKGL